MMPEEEGEFRGSGGFTRNVIIIAVLHLIGLTVILVLTLHPAKKKEEQLVWMNPGSFGNADAGSPAAGNNTPETEETPEATPETTPTPPPPTPEPSTPPPHTRRDSPAGNATALRTTERTTGGNPERNPNAKANLDTDPKGNADAKTKAKTDSHT